MKLTENKLRQIIKEEAQKLNEVADDSLRGKTIEKLVMTYQDALTIKFQDGSSADINIDPRGGFSVEKNK